MTIEEKNKEEEEWMTEKNQWQLERQEMKQQLAELVELTKNIKNNRLKEAETNEIHQAYQKALKDKDSMDNENTLLKQEIKRLQMIIASPHELDHMKNSIYVNDEDFGYSSNRNTLEKHHKNPSNASSQLSEGESISLQHSNIQNNNSGTSTFERKLKSLFGFSSRGGKKISVRGLRQD